MAIYDNLPVYKSAYDLLVQVFKFAHNLQRDYRYTIGENLKNELIGIILCIYRANSVTDKVPHIQQAREHVVVVKLMLRMLCDMKQISVKQFAFSAQGIESVSKQLAAWNKFMQDTDAQDAQAAKMKREALPVSSKRDIGKYLPKDAASIPTGKRERIAPKPAHVSVPGMGDILLVASGDQTILVTEKLPVEKQPEPSVSPENKQPENAKPQQNKAQVLPDKTDGMPQTSKKRGPASTNP